MNLIIYFLFVYSITSIVLYSYIFDWLRKWWDKKFKGRLLEHLMLCSLCFSFHVSYLTQWLIVPFTSIKDYIVLSFVSAGISWLLCSIVLFFVEGKYSFTQYSKYKQMEFRRSQDDLR